jgi:ATP-dependent DNA helicase RecG
MSATPIPRTLAMIVYGDLDVSVIDELPAGRQKVDTYAVPSSYHARIYEYIRKFVRAGQQAYVICPLVEENEENPTSLISAEEYAKTLTSVFPEYRVGLLHGKMKPKEKEKVMQAFAANEIQILVATTVVEVGVDVPNANVMVIENAERFGLSQLHQLRGRIGRGQDAASCILVSDHKGEIAKKRLAILKATNNGFEIADEDLKLRGPGDFFGSRQHGLPQMKLADLLTDTKELSASSHAAARLLAGDPLLTDPQHVLLAKMVDDLCKQVSAS